LKNGGPRRRDGNKKLARKKRSEKKGPQTPIGEPIKHETAVMQRVPSGQTARAGGFGNTGRGRTGTGKTDQTIEPPGGGGGAAIEHKAPPNRRKLPETSPLMYVLEERGGSAESVGEKNKVTSLKL